MLKFNYLIFLLLFNFTLISANNKSNSDPDITIQLLNITSNGLILPNNTISFNGVDDLVLEFDLRTSYTGTVAKYCEGTSYAAFYEPNEFDNETAQYYNNGVEPIQLIWKPIRLDHINNNNYSYTYRQKLLFKKSTVYNTGCSIVFKYGPTKLTYKIIGGTKTGNEPHTSSVADVKLTSLSYSDGSPIIDNKIIVPDYIGNEIGTQSINLSFDFECKFGSNLSQVYYPSYQIQIRHDDHITSLTGLTTKIISLDKGTVTINNLQIKSSDIKPNDRLTIRFIFHEVDFRVDWALIKGNNEKPILSNIISDNQTIGYGEVSKPFTTSQSPYVDYSIRCDRNVRACQTIYDYRYITLFKWQTRTQNTDWTDIAGATSQEYSPNKNFYENTYYRRLAYFNNEQYSISNISAVIIQDSNIQNNICCDQPLQFKNSQPQPINGSVINSDLFTYQWQYSKNFRRNDFLQWNDLTGATNQNYSHSFTEDAITNDEKTQFRRIIKLNFLPVSISNSVVVSRYSVLDYNPPTRRSSLGSQSLTNELTDHNFNNLLFYPNPIIDNLQIEGQVDINSIKLYDSFGIIKQIDKKQKSDNTIELNTSYLPAGVYLLKIYNTTFSKTLIKN